MSDDPWIGRTLGRYTIAKLIGAGGMSRVYLAEQAAIRSRVAIKILGEDSARDTDMLERFFAEARAVNLVAHENIVTVLDLDRSPEGRPYIVMEYVDGVTLARLVRGQHASIGGAIDVVCETLDALHAAHAIGIIHRDLKPDNVLVTAAGHAKVSDFGIAKLAPHLPDRVRTRTGMMLGTPAFMSPEQIRGGDIDSRTDVYAAGVTLFEAVTGSLPFSGATDFEVLEAHLHKEAPSPRASRPELPVEVERVILRAMAKRPDERFATAADMADVLRAAAGSLAADQRAPLRRRPASIEPANVDPRAPTLKPTPPAPSAVRGRPSVSTPQPPDPRDRRVGATSDRRANTARRTLALGLVAGAVLATVAVLAVQAFRGGDDRVPPGPAVNASNAPTTDASGATVASTDTPSAPNNGSNDASPKSNDARPKGSNDAPTKPASSDASPTHPAKPVAPSSDGSDSANRRRPSSSDQGVEDVSSHGTNVHFGANVHIGEHSPHQSLDGPAPPNPHHFDGLAYIPTARALARKLFPDAALVDLAVRGVAADGYADLALNDGYTPARYTFRSEAVSHPPAGQLPTPNWEGECEVEVEVFPDHTQALVALADCRAQFLEPPPCTLAQVWAAAQQAGASPKQVATIKTEGPGKWQFDAADSPGAHLTCP